MMIGLVLPNLSLIYYQLVLVSQVCEGNLHVKFGAVCPQAILSFISKIAYVDNVVSGFSIKLLCG